MLNDDLYLYMNRQIIINEYQDEELMKRSGFYFDELHLDSHMIQFKKDGVVTNQLNWPFYARIRKDVSFPNFYIVEWDLFRIEIYFP